MSMKKQMLVATTLSMLAISAGGMTNQVLAASKSDTFTYAISGDLESTNPIATSDRWGLTFDNIQYSPLFHVAEDGSYKPVLATSHDVSSDGKTITVNLRHGVKWSDGQPFTADDVVFTYQKLADKANGNSDNLYINNQPIQIEKVNDNQVKFVLPEKSTSAVNNIMTDTFIIPKHVYDKTTDFSGSSLTPGNVGTGPYTLESYKQGQEVRFVRNAHYFGGQPKMKHVVLRILTDPNTTNIALKKGEVDASFVLPTQLKSLKSAHLKVTAYSENRVGYMGLNTHVQKLSNVKVRQAIFYALDKHEMNQAAYLNKAYYNTPVSFLPPKDKYATTDVQTYKTNDNKAKQLLHEAGVKNLTLNLGYDSSDAAQKIQANLIVAQLHKVGIKVNAEAADSTALSAAMHTKGQTKYDSFLDGYIMGLDPHQYTPLYASNGQANYWQYHRDELDKLFAKGDAETTEASRKATYKQLQQKIADAAIVYPIVDNKKILVINKDVKGANEAKNLPIYTFADWSKLSK
ncbi:ABC transporter substrate-binding protein [Weissella confusa]|uniref:ABC transporter substrate-binding protein n=1 Tax=Weissella confusa TaxID=1583 RepID=UPI0022FF27E6|nr:ABC transporter substrate-binding protein [Weissella confusa]MDA5458424.1 Oligopeptide ABC transporter, periplasmic oligopeptide-binding protein OppA [Weissella confusa]